MHRAPLIVVGGSVSGLHALSRVVTSLPPGFPATIAAVLHTNEQSPRFVASILGRKTPLHVAYAEDGDVPRLSWVYIAPPGAHLIVKPSGHFGLETSPKVNHSRPAADRLFETAAAVYGRQVIGIVLSGDDGDGTKGLTEIKRRGGVCIVQSPSDAEAQGMPLTAIKDDGPDHVVLIDQLSPLILSLVGQRA